METKIEKLQSQQDLLEACKKDQLSRVIALLREGVNPQFTFEGLPQSLVDEKNYLTPIGEILKAKQYTTDHLEVLEELLAAGVDVNSPTDHATDDKFETPLGIVLGRIENYRKNPEAYQQILNLLLSKGADVALVNPLRIYSFVTSEFSTKELLMTFIAIGFDLNMIFRGRSLVEHLIVKSSAFMPVKNQYEKLKLLIESGAAIPGNMPKDSRDIDPLVFSYLVEKSPEIISVVTLHDLFVLTSPGILPLLISRGLDLNLRDEYGRTPLMKCCAMGYDQAAVILMEAGADLDIVDVQGRVALHYAFSNVFTGDNQGSYYRANSRLFIALELYIRGAAPVRDIRGNTPLMSLNNPEPRLVKFCLGEFAQFEAKHFKVDPYKLAVSHWYFHVPETKNLYEGTSDTEKRFSVSVQDKSGLYFIQDVIIKADVDLTLPKQRLIAALENNNLTIVRMVIENFPNLDLSNVKNAKGHQVLTMLIDGIIRNSERDCLPILRYLADKVKSTEYNGPLSFALNALGAADTDAKTRNVLQIIQELLLIGFSLNKIYFFGRGRAHSPGWKKLIASEVYQNYQAQPGNTIDEILLVICSKDTFLQAVKKNFYICIYEEHSESDRVYLVDILKSLLESSDLTPYSRNCVKNVLLEAESAFLSPFSTTDTETLTNLTRNLYLASKGVAIDLSQEFADKLQVVGDKRSRVDSDNEDSVTPFWKRGTVSGLADVDAQEEGLNKFSFDTNSSFKFL